MLQVFIVNLTAKKDYHEPIELYQNFQIPQERYEVVQAGNYGFVDIFIVVLESAEIVIVDNNFTMAVKGSVMQALLNY